MSNVIYHLAPLDRWEVSRRMSCRAPTRALSCCALLD